MFHDEVEVVLESGKGGDGIVSFRREKYIPKGGPDGGDGGTGGDVYIEATQHMSDLGHLASVTMLKAENGQPGSGKKLYGRAGEDLTVRVPVGTRVYKQVHGEWRLVVDLTKDEQRQRVLRGGKGGLGNVHFATATNQTPRHAQPGEPPQRATFRFELQLIADVGIIGLPNAGKSTFLSIVSEAKPKIGAYPFTTLSPVLGIITYHDRRIVAADIPGLIEGASAGKGLGHLFLRHVKRTKALLHLIDALSDDYARDYATVRAELGNYDPGMLEKPELVVITKSELITPDTEVEFKAKVARLRAVIQSPSSLFEEVSISAVTRENIDSLLASLVKLVSS